MSKFVGGIVGHAIGDAMGVPTEFFKRDELMANPVVDMIKARYINQPEGSWSDDTSMEIATIESFIEKRSFDYDDIMKKWVEWILDGTYSCNGKAFGMGNTCLAAITNFYTGIKPLECGLNDIRSNGNGSLMRILPVALYCYSKKIDDNQIIKLVNDISSLTHAHDISKMGCFIYVKFVIYLLSGLSKEEAYNNIKNLDYSMYSEDAINVYDRILNNDIKEYSLKTIKSTGYVVDTLECVLWIFLNAESYTDCIVASTNMGDDTDSIGAIVGSMAGILYGYDSIPTRWLDKLQRKDYLIDLANKFETAVMEN